MYKNKSGFTLIELMIVIAMIATLTTMALPSFQDRVIRTQVQEALDLAGIAQEGVADYYKQHGRLPVSNQEAGLPAAEKIIGNFTSRVEVVDGAVQVTLGKKINRHAQGMIVSLRPAIVQGESRVPIAWVCGQGSVPEGMVSSVTNATTLPNRLLPIECRY